MSDKILDRNFSDHRTQQATTSFHTNLDAIPPQYGTAGHPFTAMLYLGNSDTYVCRTVNARLFDLTEFSDSSDTQYSLSCDDSDSFEDDAKNSKVKLAKSELKEKTLEKKAPTVHRGDDIKKDKEGETKVTKLIESVQNMTNDISSYTCYQQIAEICANMKLLIKKNSYRLAGVFFILCSVLIFLSISQSIYKSLGQLFKKISSSHLYSLFLQSATLFLFLRHTIETILILFDSKREFRKSFYLGILRYYPLFHFQTHILIVAYGIRIVLETIITAEVRIIRCPGSLKYLITIVGIILLCCYLSNKPSSIEYFSCWKHFIFMFAFADRVIVTPQLVDLAKYSFEKINESLFSLYWIRQLFYPDNKFQDMFSYMLQTVAFSTTMILVHDFAALMNRTNVFFDEYEGVYSTTVVTSLQIIAIFINPIFAIFLSVLFLEVLSDNERHGVLTAILAAPRNNIGGNLEGYNYLKESMVTLITFPVVKIICSFMAPMPYKQGSIIRKQSVRDSLCLPETRGTRTCIFYISKILSLIVAVKLSLITTLAFIHIVFGWIMYNIVRLDPALYDPVNIIAVLFLPWILAVGFPSKDSNYVSILFAKSIYYGANESKKSLQRTIKTALLTTCLRKMKGVSTVEVPGLITYYIKSRNMTLTLPEALENYSTSMVVYLVNNNISITTAFLYFSFYSILLPRIRVQIQQMFLRVVTSSILAVFMVVTIGGLLAHPSVPVYCKKHDLSQISICQSLIAEADDPNPCQAIGGEVI